MDKVTSERFKEMRAMRPIFENELKVFDKILEDYRVFDNSSLSDYCYGIYRRRIKDKKGVSVRAYFAIKTFQYFQFYMKRDVSSYQNLIEKIAFIIDSVILIQYLDNQILDKKFGVITHAQINKNLVSSNILKELLFEYIEYIFGEKGELKDLKGKARIRSLIENKVRRIFLKTDLGQRIEKEFSTYDNYKSSGFTPLNGKLAKEIDNYLKPIQPVIESVKEELRKPEKAPFLDMYFKRIFLTNSYLFVGTVELIGSILEVEKERYYQSLIDFSVAYAMALQIVNDNADFVIGFDDKQQEEKGIQTAGKSNNDYLSDLHNKNVTLPIFLHLDKSRMKRNVEIYLGGKEKDRNLIDDYKELLVRETIGSGAIIESIEVGKKIAKIGIEHLDEKNDATKYLKSSAEIAFENKYYQQIAFENKNDYSQRVIKS